MDSPFPHLNFCFRYNLVPIPFLLKVSKLFMIQMSLDKYQKFLKNKHKFDPKPLYSTVIENFSKHTLNFMNALKSEDDAQVQTALRPFVVDLIKYMNRHDFSFDDLIKEEYNK